MTFFFFLRYNRTISGRCTSESPPRESFYKICLAWPHPWMVIQHRGVGPRRTFPLGNSQREGRIVKGWRSGVSGYLGARAAHGQTENTGSKESEPFMVGPLAGTRQVLRTAKAESESSSHSDSRQKETQRRLQTGAAK